MTSTTKTPSARHLGSIVELNPEARLGYLLDEFGNKKHMFIFSMAVAPEAATKLFVGAPILYSHDSHGFIERVEIDTVPRPQRIPVIGG
jgi:hypothetical protein